MASGSSSDIANAVAYGRKVGLCPLAQATNPPATRFVDAANTVYDSTIPYDLRFYQLLDRFVQREPWIERDKAMIDMLKSIDIEQGKTFAPDQKTQATLNEAVGEANAWLQASYEAAFRNTYFPGSRWAVPVQALRDIPGMRPGNRGSSPERGATPACCHA